MTTTLLSDVEARAERRRTRTRNEWLHDVALQTWRRANAASDPVDALRWLERAHRLLPTDDLIVSALAAALLGQGSLPRAEALFQGLAERHGTIEAWTGLATCAHLRGDVMLLRSTVETALRTFVPTPTLETLAELAAPGAWCGLTLDGAIHAAGPVRGIALDGVAMQVPSQAGRVAMPERWQRAAAVVIEGPAGPMLGSPLPISGLLAVEGFVEAELGGLVGWAWHRSDPDRAPVLHIRGPRGSCILQPDEPADGVLPGRPLARPRRFRLTAAEVAALGEPIALTGPDGKHLFGSPIAPGLEVRAAMGGAGFTPIWADIVGPPPERLPPRRPPIDVIIPVYRGLDETLACVTSVLASIPRATRVIVVDDASPDPALMAALSRLARARRIHLIRLPENRGFPGAANAGLRAAVGRDAVLLNSDTLVPPGWLDRLRAAAYSAADIGTVTPLSNDGTIVSIPDRHGSNPVPDLDGTVAQDALAQRANANQVVTLPVGVGFCLYVRRDCLDRVGLLREDLFAQGYGEENDLCLRARHAGFRNVAALDVFVAHVGATSFGDARAHLIRRNSAILERLHPGYAALIARHEADDPLAPARRRMDVLRWVAGRRRGGSVVLISHANGGGVERVVQARAAAAAARGQTAIIVRPAPGQGARLERAGEVFPNLVFPMPDGLPGLVALLRKDRPMVVEIHHLLAHHHGIAGLAHRLGVPSISVVHDYARFCPRIALVGPDRRYCGEPDLAGCEACIADLGSLLVDDPAVPDLLARSAAELHAAVQVVAPSVDAAARITRHFPGIAVVAEPWENEAALPPLSPAPPAATLSVVVVGAIGTEKGFEVLLACARDARARNLPIAYTVVGFTADDERLMQAGPVFVTGEFQEADAVDLIRQQGGHLALIPSVWPETWCFALTRAWQAGLPAAVFDIGAPAERVRQTGRGWVLPFGLSGRGLNDALLRLAPGALASQCPIL